MAWKSANSPISSRSAASNATRCRSGYSYGLERLAMFIKTSTAFTTSTGTACPRTGAAKPMAIFSKPPNGNSRRIISSSPTPPPCCVISRNAEQACAALLEHRPAVPLAAYDQCLKASHLFNLLDARGVISVTERQAYIGRVRALFNLLPTGWPSGRAGPWLSFALELFSEEIPARMQARAATDLKRLVTEKLTAAGLTFDDARACHRPRRLAIAGLPTATPDRKEEKNAAPRSAPPNRPSPAS